MRKVVEGKKRADEYRASPEYAAVLRRHDEWLKEHELPPRDPWQKVRTRKRRGKIVAIPEVWQGVVTYPQTIRKRNPIKRRTRKENR